MLNEKMLRDDVFDDLDTVYFQFSAVNNHKKTVIEVHIMSTTETV